MPHILSDPGLEKCPNYASPIYEATRAPLVNDNTTEAQAIQFLKNIWTAGNQADKVSWQQQKEQDEALRTEQLHTQLDADNMRAQT